MRADARKNYNHLLAVARETVNEHGATASLRDIARRAGVGLATLYRHFPSRDDLIKTLLSTDLAHLSEKADALQKSDVSGDEIVGWFESGVDFFRRYRGVADLMAAADADPGSALYTSCKTMRDAGTRLLERAQKTGAARQDIDGADLFALIAAAGWLSDQSAFADRSARLSNMIACTILTQGTADGGLTARKRGSVPA